MNCAWLKWSWMPTLMAMLGLMCARADAVWTKPSPDQVQMLASSLQWQTGTIVLKGGLATIRLTDNFRFLGNADARKVLHQIWGNPDEPHILGLIFPKDKGPLDHGGYCVTVDYEAGGYVKDDDADKINYTDLLKQMQTAAHDANPQRVKEGYPSIEIIGWAQPPRYDKATHKLYWAKELHFGETPGNTLNYDIRILGRRGVLVLSAISSMERLPEINDRIPEILAMVDFQPGNSYADFDPKVDKVAEYGLAALVAGGGLAAAAKLGLFGVIAKYGIALVLLLKKAAIVVVVAVIAAVKKAWAAITGRSGRTTVQVGPPPDRP